MTQNIYTLRQALGKDENDNQFIENIARRGYRFAVPIKVSSSASDAQSVSLLAISPDGSRLAYHQVIEKSDSDDDESNMRIGILPVFGDAELKRFDLFIRRPIIQWSGDNTFLYTGGTFNSSAVYEQSIFGENPQKLLELPDRIFNFAFSKDGKNLVVSRGNLQGDAILITNLP